VVINKTVPDPVALLVVGAPTCNTGVGELAGGKWLLDHRPCPGMDNGRDDPVRVPSCLFSRSLDCPLHSTDDWYFLRYLSWAAVVVAVVIV